MLTRKEKREITNRNKLKQFNKTIFRKNVLVEKFYPGIERVIVIKTCSTKGNWHEKEIGNVYLGKEYVNQDNFYLFSSHAKIIKKSDCEVIK